MSYPISIFKVCSKIGIVVSDMINQVIILILSRVWSAPENARDAALPLRKSREGEECARAVTRERHLPILLKLGKD